MRQDGWNLEEESAEPPGQGIQKRAELGREARGGKNELFKRGGGRMEFELQREKSLFLTCYTYGT